MSVILLEIAVVETWYLLHQENKIYMNLSVFNIIDSPVSSIEYCVLFRDDLKWYDNHGSVIHVPQSLLHWIYNRVFIRS